MTPDFTTILAVLNVLPGAVGRTVGILNSGGEADDVEFRYPSPGTRADLVRTKRQALEIDLTLFAVRRRREVRSRFTMEPVRIPGRLSCCSCLAVIEARYPSLNCFLGHRLPTARIRVFLAPGRRRFRIGER